MKAVVYTQYGSPDVLHLKDVARPMPKDQEILVKVRAVSINYGDLIARNFKNVSPRAFNMPSIFWLPARIEFGFRKPKRHILGSEFAGEVEAIGKAVTRFKVGDQVFGYLGALMGANAEYLCIAETGLVTHKPANLSYEEAASIPYGALTALTLLRKVNIQRGQKVLVNGASGSIGAAAVQIAKHFGAEVIGVCSTPRLEFVKAIGADRVIDYTREDFTQGSETYDLIFDVLGKGSFSRARRVLKKNGRYLFASFRLKHLLRMLWTSRFGSKKVICALSSEKPMDMEIVRALAEAGELRAVIDKCYPLEQTAEAHRYVESGSKRGNVVITLAHHGAY
ncbi:MAG: NAD(P)-dependent alcohol dehydrogenase [Chloroflexi bacterium CFX4]|nr:NAD(P)-dependent alcohol dehydrogenase [Chloroflexi bacterium CFX4]MDL1922891.1 NAD(P)-dependent alcohol dehydrogenase [Chloroflexi bacterium CFX3]